MKHLIACRLASYGEFQERGWSHLTSVGIHHVEIPAPAPDQLDAVRTKLQKHGLSASSLQAKCDITGEDAVQQMRPQLQACKELNASVCFLSLKGGQLDRQILWSRIRALGDAAAEVNIPIALETHPDLITNAQVALNTMQSVNHPFVRINFDTANVYFYNQNVTAEGELAPLAEYVASVHLKETNGQCQSWHFPALGAGVVNFPRVFEILDARGFTGPYTLEIEGIRGIQLDEAGQLKMIEDSVAYLTHLSIF